MTWLTLPTEDRPPHPTEDLQHAVVRHRFVTPDGAVHSWCCWTSWSGANAALAANYSAEQVHDLFTKLGCQIISSELVESMAFELEEHAAAVAVGDGTSTPNARVYQLRPVEPKKTGKP